MTVNEPIAKAKMRRKDRFNCYPSNEPRIQAGLTAHALEYMPGPAKRK